MLLFLLVQNLIAMFLQMKEKLCINLFPDDIKHHLMDEIAKDYICQPETLFIKYTSDMQLVIILLLLLVFEINVLCFSQECSHCLSRLFAKKLRRKFQSFIHKNYDQLKKCHCHLICESNGSSLQFGKFKLFLYW